MKDPTRPQDVFALRLSVLERRVRALSTGRSALVTRAEMDAAIAAAIAQHKATP